MSKLMKIIVQWLKILLKSLLLDHNFIHLQMHTYTIIIAILSKKHVVFRLSHDVINLSSTSMLIISLLNAV